MLRFIKYIFKKKQGCLTRHTAGIDADERYAYCFLRANLKKVLSSLEGVDLGGVEGGEELHGGET